MRPPVLPSGNLERVAAEHPGVLAASMRPPVLPSGNARVGVAQADTGCRLGFNEAAGFTQRKPRRVLRLRARRRHAASMRPPVLPSGNGGGGGGEGTVVVALQ